MLRKKVIQFMCLTMTASMIAGGVPMTAFAADSLNQNTAVSTQSVSLEKLPMTQLPTLEAGKKYTTTVHMYNVSTLQSDDSGNLLGEISMGELCFASNTADLVANEDGTVRVTLHFQAITACNAFNYFNNQQDYETYSTSKEQYAENIQALKKGGTVDAPADNVEYTYEKTSEYYNLDKAITSITFTLPSTSPEIFFSVKAMGMYDGEQEVFGVLGFDYSKLKEVKDDSTDPSNPGGTTDPSNPGGTTDPSNPGGTTDPSNPGGSTDPSQPGDKTDTDDPYAHPDSEDATIKHFWNLYDFYFKTLKYQDYYFPITSSTYANKSYKDVKEWLDRTAVRVQTEQLSDADKEELSKQIATYANWMTELVAPKYQGLETGKIYTVPVKVYKMEKKDRSDLDIAGIYEWANTSEPAANGEYIPATATVSVGGNGYVTAKFDIDISDLKDDKSKGWYYISNQNSATGFYARGYSNLIYMEEYTAAELGLEFPDITVNKQRLPLKTAEIYMYGALEQVKCVTSLCKDGKYDKTTKEQNVIIFDYANAREIGETESDFTLCTHDFGHDSNSQLNNLIYRVQDIIDGADNTEVGVKYMYRKETSEEVKNTGIVEKAQALYAKENLTEDEADAMIQELLDVVNAQHPMKYYLRESALELQALNEDDYTSYSWKKYSDSVTDAVKLAKYTDKDTDAEGNSVVSADDINWDKYGTFQYEPGSGFMFDNIELPGCILKQDDETQAAKAALVSVKDLRAAIETAKGYTNTDGIYAASTFTDLQDSIASAENLLTTTEEVTADDVNKAIEDLGNKENALLDVTTLKSAVSEAKKYTNDDGIYTKGSFTELQTAIKMGEALISGDETATADKLTAAVTNIQAKETQLVEISGLKAAIDRAEELLKQTDVYTEASLTSLENVLTSGSSTGPKTVYNNEKATKEQVANAIEKLNAQIEALVQKSGETLDVNKLADGTYSVAVNLWHATQDKASMGDSALYHTATLTVKDGKYTLRIKGHSMTMSGQTGALDKFRLVTDGSEAKGDGSNYTEMTIQQDGTDYYVDIPLENTSDGSKVSDYYYGGIVVHTVDADGNVQYPMGKNWVSNRLRVSWDTLSVLDVQNYPKFEATDAATGIKVTAPEGALPAGTKMEVTAITGGDDQTTVNNALVSLADKNTPYKVLLYVENEDGTRTTVEPKDGMELSITLPVPAGYDTSKLAVYYIDADGNASEVKGTLDGSTYTIVTSKVGIYAVSEKKVKGITYNITGKPTSTTKPTATVDGKTTLTSANADGTNGTTPTLTGKSVKTGDESHAAMWMFTAMLSASAAALLSLFRRKKEQ